MTLTEIKELKVLRDRDAKEGIYKRHKRVVDKDGSERAALLDVTKVTFNENGQKHLEMIPLTKEQEADLQPR